MAFLKYAVPAAALAGSTFAQSSCTVSATTTITAAADATAIANCPRFSGSIALGSAIADPVSLDGQLAEIDGNLIGSNAVDVPSLSASNLQNITGDFVLTNMTALTGVTFPQLNNIAGRMLWQTVPALAGLTFGTGVQRINEVTILDTPIQDLSRINLKSAQAITIGQNSRLTTLSWQLSSVDGLLNLDGNGGQQGFNATFGNLRTAGQIAVNSVNSFVANSLKTVNGTLTIVSSAAEELRFPNLTSSGDIRLIDNAQLSNISFPVLAKISGSLFLQRNPELSSDVSFPALTDITGALNATGTFNELALPEINTIGGAVNVSSSGALSDTCNTINKDWPRQGVIKVTPGCHSGQKSATVTGDNSTQTDNGGTPSSSAAAAGLIIPGTVSLGSLFAVMFGLL